MCVYDCGLVCVCENVVTLRRLLCLVTIAQALDKCNVVTLVRLLRRVTLVSCDVCVCIVVTLVRLL